MADLSQALAVAERYPVFPCQPDTKAPLTPHGFKDATQDPDIISSWWTKFPDALIGIPTGSTTDLVVLDIDRKNGHDGFKTLGEKNWAVPRTYTVSTRNNGAHSYFRANGTVLRSTAGVLGDGLDTRGEGGYVIHWATENCPVLVPEELALIPDWLVAALAQPKVEHGQQRPNNETIHTGERNAHLASLAGSMQRRGMSQAAVAAALRIENTEKCSPPLSDLEVARIASSVGRYEPSVTPTMPKALGWGPDTDRLGLDALTDEPPDPPFVIQGFVPVDVTALVATGGTGKSTLTLQLGIHIVLGRSFWGMEIERPGPVVIITAEDDTTRVIYRLFHIAQQMGLSAAEQKHVAANLYIRDFVGSGIRLAELDDCGNIRPTELPAALIERYGEIQPSLLVFDPMVKFGPGERLVNDAEDALVNAAMCIKRGLNCCVQLTHHVSKMVARDGIIDHHAGRGGSALGDGARGVFQLVTAKSRNEVKCLTTDEELASGAVMSFHVTKLTDAPRPREPFWLVRKGWLYELREGSSEADTRAARDRERQVQSWEDVRTIQRYIQSTTQKLSKKSIEHLHPELGIGRNAIRSALAVGIAKGWLSELELPDSEKIGARKTYIAVGSGYPDTGTHPG